MLPLLCFALSWLLVAGGFFDPVRNIQLCYGANLQFPFEFASPRLTEAIYFTPRKGENASRIVIYTKRQPKDPRVKDFADRIYLFDLREEDEGTFVFQNSRSLYKSMTLTLSVKDCAEPVTKYYGDQYSFSVPTEAEIMEFASSDNKKEVMVVWRRGRQNPPGARVKMKWREGAIEDLTRLDNGYYNLRKGDNTLIWRTHLTVEARSQQHEGRQHSSLLIYQNARAFSRTVTFTPVSGSESTVLIRDERVVDEGRMLQSSFGGRLSLRDEGLEIFDLKLEDAGIYDFRDQNDHLFLTAKVEVRSSPPPMLTYVAAGVLFVIMVVVCCACVKKCCFTSTPRKQQRQAPAVPYPQQNQFYSPAATADPVQRYLQRAPPSNTLITYQPAGGPATTSTVPGPLVHTPVHVHMQTPEATVAAAATGGPTSNVGMNHSTGPEPRFELKGRLAPSAPPLNSHFTTCDVYNSDKFNFVSLLNDVEESVKL